jgi:hypothetical protein
LDDVGLNDENNFHLGSIYEPIAPYDTRQEPTEVLEQVASDGFKSSTFNMKQASLMALTEDVVKTSEIEGEQLNVESVRSSLARRLGVDIGALAPVDRDVDGVVDMILDATLHCQRLLPEGSAWVSKESVSLPKRSRVNLTAHLHSSR